jgi:hypothetical protein
MERDRRSFGRTKPEAKTAVVQGGCAVMKPLVVESTTLIAIAYDLDRLVLQLEFRDQTIYHYFDVPVDVFQGLVSASSKGGYFNRAIRGRFVHTRVKVTASLS